MSVNITHPSLADAIRTHVLPLLKDKTMCNMRTACRFWRETVVIPRLNIVLRFTKHNKRTPASLERAIRYTRFVSVVDRVVIALNQSREEANDDESGMYGEGDKVMVLSTAVEYARGVPEKAAALYRDRMFPTKPPTEYNCITKTPPLATCMAEKLSFYLRLLSGSNGGGEVSAFGFKGDTICGEDDEDDMPAWTLPDEQFARGIREAPRLRAINIQGNVVVNLFKPGFGANSPASILAAIAESPSLQVLDMGNARAVDPFNNRYGITMTELHALAARYRDHLIYIAQWLGRSATRLDLLSFAHAFANAEMLAAFLGTIEQCVDPRRKLAVKIRGGESDGETSIRKITKVLREALPDGNARKLKDSVPWEDPFARTLRTTLHKLPELRLCLVGTDVYPNYVTMELESLDHVDRLIFDEMPYVVVKGATVPRFVP